MKRIFKMGILLIAVISISSCMTKQSTEKRMETITVILPVGDTLQVRVKTVDGSLVKVQGADKTVISGTDEVRELKEDKPMQSLVATGTTIVFIGNICDFDIKDNNNVESVDVSQCPNLEVLYCAGNKITQLQLSENKALRRLQCYNNRLTTLDVSQQVNLELLWCGINRLAMLEVSGCKKLNQLRCYMNVIGNDAMDALLNSLPAKNENDSTVIREARILAIGDKITNEKPSKTALQQAYQKGWNILDSGDTLIEP